MKNRDLLMVSSNKRMKKHLSASGKSIQSVGASTFSLGGFSFKDENTASDRQQINERLREHLTR